MTTCHALDDKLPAYLSGALETAECELLEGHAAQCTRCAALLEERTRLDIELPRTLSPPEWVRAAVLERVATAVAARGDARKVVGEQDTSPRPATHKPGWRRWVLPLAATTLAMLGVNLFGPPSKEAMMREREMRSPQTLATARAAPEFDEFSRARDALSERWNLAEGEERERLRRALRQLQELYSTFLSITTFPIRDVAAPETDAAPDSGPPVSTPPVSALPVRATGRVRVLVPAGRVSVRYWALDSVALTAVAAGQVTVTERTTGAGLEIAVAWSDSSAAGFPDARLQITLPLDHELHVHAGTASVDVVGGRAPITVQSVTGRVQVSDAGGAVAVYSLNGEVDVRRSAARVAVVSGAARVRLRDVAGPLQLSTVRGAVELRSSRNVPAVLPQGEIHTVSGTVSFIVPSGEVAASGPLSVSSYDGVVETRLDDGGAFRALPAGVRVERLDATVSVGTPGGI